MPGVTAESCGSRCPTARLQHPTYGTESRETPWSSVSALLHHGGGGSSPLLPARSYLNHLVTPWPGIEKPRYLWASHCKLTPLSKNHPLDLTWAVCRLFCCHLHKESDLLALGERVACPDPRKAHSEEQARLSGGGLLFNPLPLWTLLFCGARRHKNTSRECWCN